MADANSSGITILRMNPDEDRIKKYVLTSMENIANLMKEITANILKYRLDYESIVLLKAEIVSLYFFYARPKIEVVNASLTTADREKKSFDELYDLDYYLQNPSELNLDNAFYYCTKIRDLFETLGMFELEKIGTNK